MFWKNMCSYRELIKIKKTDVAYQDVEKYFRNMPPKLNFLLDTNEKILFDD